MIAPAEWAATTNYSTGDLATYRGVIVKAIADITGDAMNTPPLYVYSSATGYSPGDRTNWVANGVADDGQSLLALTEAIKFITNTDDPEILNSIPMAIKDTERSFYMRQRVPVMIQRQVLTVDDVSKVTPPSDLYSVLQMNLRSDRNADSGDSFSSLINSGRIEIIRANFFEGQWLDFNSRNDENYFGVDRKGVFRSLTYTRDGNSFRFHPPIATGSQVDLIYYAKIPELGTTLLLTNAAGEPVNQDGMTLDQWVAAGNPANTFVQGTRYVDTNWFSEIKPDMIKFGAIMNLEQYLHDDKQWAIWQAKYTQAEAELTELVERFEDRGPNTSVFYTTYPI